MGLGLRIGVQFQERQEDQGKWLVLSLGDMWSSEVNFHVKRKTRMETLKTLGARSVAARVTSEKSMINLEVPRTLIKDLVSANRDSWKTRNLKHVKKNLSLMVLKNMSYMRKCPYCKKKTNKNNSLYVHIAQTRGCSVQHQRQLDISNEPRFFLPILE